MRALTLKCRYVDLSYAFDGLTIYTKENEIASEKMAELSSACHQLEFVNSTHDEQISRQIKNEAVRKCMGFYNQMTRNILINDNLGNDYQRYIHFDDNDHELYHRDNFLKSQNHVHIKFNRIINQNQLLSLLNIMIKLDMLSHDAKNEFINLFCNRFTSAREKLQSTLTGKIEPDAKNIIQFIHACGDDNILADLHDFLLDQKFDYLRRTTFGANNGDWQGETSAHQMMIVSKEWAMIEKSFSLQMAYNLESNCTFNLAVAKERTEQLTNLFSFFAIPRKVDAKHTKSKAIGDFERGNKEEFERRYNKHFI